jgi:ATP-dependent Zn protease
MTVAPTPTEPTWLEAHRVTLRGLTFDAVIGLHAANREVQSLIARLAHPEVIVAAGGNLPRGVLFYGPPGCGKTLMARVMASLLRETGEVEFYSVAASDLNASRFEDLSRWVATRPAEAPRLVIYIDEVDLWALDRSHYQHSDDTRATLLGALAAIDGLEEGVADRVLWLASSNQQPRSLDAAFVRPGRYGFWVQVGPGTKRDRVEVLRYYAATRRVAPDIDWERAAALAGHGTTPAALRQALDDALALALAEDGADAVVQARHVEEAISKRGLTTERPEPTADETWATAIHEASHAVASIMLGVVVTAISLRRDGGTTESTIDDANEYAVATEEDTRRQLVIGMAGMSGEALVLGQLSMGSSSDIVKATGIAMTRVHAGVEPAARIVNYGAFTDDSLLAADERFQAVAAALNAARREADRLILTHREAVETIARHLVTERHLSGRTLNAALVAAGLVARDMDPDQLVLELQEA